MNDLTSIVLVTAAWSGAVGLIGLAVAYLLRRRSTRVLIGLVTLINMLAPKDCPLNRVDHQGMRACGACYGPELGAAGGN